MIIMCQCRSLMPGDSPERSEIDGNSFYTAVLLQALELTGTAELQQGQHPQPDARLAVARCLDAAGSRVRSGLLFKLEPSQCIELVRVADRVMAGFAAAPEAASAAFIMMPNISNFLTGVGGSLPGCVQKLSRVRHSLLASVQQLLEGPAPFLTGVNVAARGSVVVVEAASTILGAITAAWWAGGIGMADDISRPAAFLLQQCQALLVDSKIAAQLRERQRYPLCSLATSQSPAGAELLARLAGSASELLIGCMDGIFHAEMCLHTQGGIVAASQQQLLALSTAVKRPALMYGLVTEPPGSVQQLVPAAYASAFLLASWLSSSTVS